MNLSRKNQRQIKRLRKDAAKLWAEPVSYTHLRAHET